MNSSIYSILNGDNLALIEEIFQQYQKAPESLKDGWPDFFRHLENGGTSEVSHDLSSNVISERRKNNPLKEMGVQNVLNMYRAHGHLAASIDPLGIRTRTRNILDQKLASLGSKDMEMESNILEPAYKATKLKDTIPIFEKIYCDTIAYEHHYLVNEEERLWLQNKIESYEHNQPIPKETKFRLYKELVHADFFEKFLARKYIGKKRFSVEGGESFIPLLNTVVEKAGEIGIECIVMGMAHRGRLNVLVNTLKKPASQIFAEFEENYDPNVLDYADVKYHLGYSNYVETPSGKKVKLSLAFNPSHLEAVNPVVMGSVRARQSMAGDTKRDRFMGLLVHGDAAFAGQGVVAESLNLVNLEHFDIGGVLHIVFNNQIGFTTLPHESRSTLYATDLAKGFQIPIFHVNGDDPEAVFRVACLAMSYRKKFKKDVIIDLICYRKLGHNETDEPAFTQPSMYSIIRNHKNTMSIYEDRILQDGDIDSKEVEVIKREANKILESAFNQVKEGKTSKEADTLKERWSSYSREEKGRA